MISIEEHVKKAESLLTDIAQKVKAREANVDVSLAAAQEATAHAILALVKVLGSDDDE
jgi:hypothetical protein